MSSRITLPLRQRITTLRWVLPLSIGLLTVFYEIGPGRWIHDAYGAREYFVLDIIFYATIAPLLAFWVLTLISQWLDEKERAEKHARASEQRLASITAASADAIFGLDPVGCIESWNHGAELIFGYPAHEILGRPLTNLLGGGEAAQVEFRWLVEGARRAGFVRDHETTCRDSAGHAVAVELTVTNLTAEAGQPAGMSIILRDVTERKHREEEIRRLNTSLSEQVAERTHELAEKVEQLARANAELQKLDQMRAEFVSLVSHQIRAPLTNMRGAAIRMQSDCGAIDRKSTRLNSSHSRASRMPSSA